MTTVNLNSPEVDALVRLVEESTRASDKAISRFVEPARGTLDRAKSERHHLVFGRRGSGKSSLLKKAAAELSLLRKPAAFVDLETFKGRSYPDVLLSVLIASLQKFEEWLRSAGCQGDDADEIDLDITLEKYDLAKKFLIKLLTGLMVEPGLTSPDQIFADTAIDRLVLASGGVARDFLTIFRRSIDCARERGPDSRGPRIGAEDVNRAAGEHDSSKHDELRRDSSTDETLILENAFQGIRKFCLHVGFESICWGQKATQSRTNRVLENGRNG